MIQHLHFVYVHLDTGLGKGQNVPIHMANMFKNIIPLEMRMRKPPLDTKKFLHSNIRSYARV